MQPARQQLLGTAIPYVSAVQERHVLNPFFDPFFGVYFENPSQLQQNNSPVRDGLFVERRQKRFSSSVRSGLSRVWPEDEGWPVNMPPATGLTSRSENSVGSCFRDNPSGGGSFAVGARWLGR